MELDDIIEYDEEGTNLDFKKEEYRKEKYSSLLKDVSSMANVLNNEIKRIIIGIKHEPGQEKSIIGLDSIVDQATLENIVQENIEPTINFRYYSYSYKGTMLGVIEIANNFDRPYMMKKDYGILKKGDMWIRKGSRQSKITRSDLDKIFNIKKNSIFEDKIELGFGKELLQGITLQKADIKSEEFPSEIRKKEFQKLLGKLEERYEKKDEEIEKYDSQDFMTKFAGFSLFSEFNDKEKSIRIGYNEFNLPIYNKKEELIEKLNKVSITYGDENLYYLYEENSYKFNVNLYNKGNEFLEDVVIEVIFDPDVFIVGERVYQKPVQRSIYAINPIIENLNCNYPSVKKEDNLIYVKEQHAQIRHKTLTKVFSDDLRILINPIINIEKIEIRYVISAKNLPNHIDGSLIVTIK